MTADLRDGLIAGLAHALSNRISTLSVVAQTLEMEDADPAQLAEMLGQEVTRLEEILRLMRLVPADGRAEPLLVPELMSDVASLARHQRDLRGVDVDFDGDRDVLPIYGERSTTILRVLERITDAARAGRTRVTVKWSGDAAAVTIDVSGAEPLSLISLPEARRREGRDSGLGARGS